MKKVRQIKFSTEPLCSFANSAFNIEFVYLILLGINNLQEIRQLQTEMRKSGKIDGNSKAGLK